MTQEAKKFPFASHEWLEVARSVLEELVAEHGEEGKKFSACEVFTDAPEGLVGPDPTTAAWHFVIDGKAVTVGEGEIDNADLAPRASYSQVLMIAKMVITPEMVKQFEGAMPQAGGSGKAPPTYLLELHNRLAVVTQ